MKEYWSTITIKFGGNNLECDSEEEYNIDLRNDEIKIEGSNEC